MTTYKRLKAILLADAEWKGIFTEGNRIWFDELVPAPQKRIRAAGDLYEFKLELGAFTDDYVREDATFCGSPEVLEQDYVATITTTASDTNQMTLGALKTVRLVRAASNADGEKMGNTFTTFPLRFTSSRPRLQAIPDAPGQKRWVLEIIMRIRMQSQPGTAPVEEVP
jgi:hypothetical protein